MKAEKLSDIKKELTSLNKEQLAGLCIRLAKYKKENKELLSYLLYESENPVAYAETVKNTLIEEFHTLKRYDYFSAKQLRKILRLLAKHTKYTGSAEVELVLLLWFCSNYLQYVDLRSAYKPLHQIFIRQIEKISKLFPKLHEDLQFDYQEEFRKVVAEASDKARWFNEKVVKL